MDDDQQQRHQPPKEIRLAHREDRPSMDRGGYDSRGRDWQHERDRDRWARPEPLSDKRSDGPRNHRNEPGIRDQRDNRDNRNDRDREMGGSGSNIQLAKRKDMSRGGELSDNDQEQRPASRNKEETNKDVKSFLPPPAAATEIVSWADEPAEYDDVSPLSALAASSTSDRAFSEERSRSASGAGPRNHGPSQHHHAPAPIPRDKLEADVRAETKQSNFVPLRRTQGQQQPQQPSQQQQSVQSEEAEKKHQQQQRSTPPGNAEIGAVQNVWASRSKSRELPSDHHADSSKADERNDRNSEENDRNKGGKDVRGRPAPQPNKNNHGGSSSSSTSVAGPAAGNRRPGARRQSSNPRNSDSYDEYYEDDGYRPTVERDQHLESRKQGPEASVSVPLRKSKSPDDDEIGQRKDQQPNRPGVGNRSVPATAATAGNRGSFRERRGGGGRAGYDDEEPQPPRKTENVQQQQQRPPRFQQQDASSAASNRDHKNKQDDTWESEHSEPLSRSGRRGGGAGGGRGGSNTTAPPGDRRRGGGKPDSHGDYHYRQEGDSKEPSVEDSYDRKPAAQKDRPQQPSDDKRQRNDPKDARDRGGDRGGDRNRGGGAGGRNDDRNYRGPATGPNNKTADQRFDQRPVKANLPPRLAAKLAVETQGRSSNKGHGKNEGGSGDIHSHDGPSREPGSSSKESTPPVQAQQLQQQPSWEKSTGGAPSPAGLSSGLASMSIADKPDVDDMATTVILDGTTPPAQTIIFENTNLKSSDKGRGTPPVVVVPSANSQGPKAAQKSAEASNKTSVPTSTQQLPPTTATAATASKDSDHSSSYGPGARMKNGIDSGPGTSPASAAQSGPPPASVYSSTAGGLQLGVGLNKSSMAGQSQGVNVSGSGTMPRIQHIATSSVQSPISPSTAELNMKIASVKKVRAFILRI